MRFSAIAAAAGRAVLRVGLAVGVIGCGSGPLVGSPAPVDLFAPRDMRIHPIFTQVADLTGGGKPDGIEAQLEFDDQFGDPTKASGQVLFELFEYRRQPPFTGKRVAGPWVASLATPAEQRDKWNKTLRTYRFPLAYTGISPTVDYVLTATFELTGGGRFFDKRALPARHPDKNAGDAKGGPLGL